MSKHDHTHRIANERGVSVWGCIECSRISHAQPGSPIERPHRGDATRTVAGCFLPGCAITVVLASLVALAVSIVIL